MLVGIVKAHIRNYLGVLFDLIHDFWNPDSTLQFSITSLVESIAVAVEGQFKAFLPKLLQELLRTFEGDISAGKLSDRRKQNLLRMIKAFYVFGASVEEYMHLILPVIVKCFERTDAPFELRSTAIQTIGHLCRKVNLSDNISQIIHPLARVLAGDEPDLKVTAMDSLCAIVLQLGPDYAIFIPMINKVRHLIVQLVGASNLMSFLLENRCFSRRRSPIRCMTRSSRSCSTARCCRWISDCPIRKFRYGIQSIAPPVG